MKRRVERLNQKIGLVWEMFLQPIVLILIVTLMAAQVIMIGIQHYVVSHVNHTPMGLVELIESSKSNQKPRPHRMDVPKEISSYGMKQ